MVDWSRIRAEFPAVSRYTYMNTAGAPPLSRRAAAEGQRYYAEMLASGDVNWPQWLEQAEEVRRRVARFVAADPDEICFAFSTSHAMNLLAALAPSPGHVVAMADEFPSGTLPFLQHGDDVTFVPADAAGTMAVADIERAITAGTRAVVSSSVMYRTGFRQDLRALGEMCRRRGVRLIVDASQSMGVVPVDVRRDGIDALVFSGYKWTMAGYGIAAMYVARDWLQASRLPMVGWFSANDPEAVINDRLDLKRSAAALEVGSPHFAGIFALGGALALLEEIGQPAIERRVEALTDYLHARLDRDGFEIASPRDRAQRAGITIVALADARAVVESLAARGVLVSARGAGIRIAVHVFNNEEDIDRCVDALLALRRDVGTQAGEPA